MTVFDENIALLVAALGAGVLCLFIWLIWHGVKAARLKPEDPKFTQLAAKIRPSDGAADWHDRFLAPIFLLVREWFLAAATAIFLLVGILTIAVIVAIIVIATYVFVYDPLTVIEIALVVIVILLIAILFKLKSK